MEALEINGYFAAKHLVRRMARRLFSAWMMHLIPGRRGIQRPEILLDVRNCSWAGERAVPVMARFVLG